jgi:hypothetical protein
MKNNVKEEIQPTEPASVMHFADILWFHVVSLMPPIENNPTAPF